MNWLRRQWLGFRVSLLASYRSARDGASFADAVRTGYTEAVRAEERRQANG